MTSSDGPVALEVTLVRVRGPGLYRVRAVVTADAGWHHYASVPASSQYPVTTPKIILPAGVEQIGAWTSTAKAVPAADLSGTTWYEGSVEFCCELRTATRITEPLTVSVRLQVCDDQVCMPPTELKVEVLH